MATDQEIRELTRAAYELVEKIGELTGDSSEQLVALARTARNNRRMIYVLWLSFMLDVALTVAIAFGFVSINKTTDAIQEVRTVERREALCPLYRQFINSDTPEARKRAEAAGQDMEARAEAFRVIRSGYSSLGCHQFEKEDSR